MNRFRNIERQISQLRDHEEAFVFNAHGKQVLHKVGGDHYVDFSDGSLEGLENYTLIHNHPNAHSHADGLSPFSQQDVLTFLNTPARELRAVDAKRVHIVRKKRLFAFPGFVAEELLFDALGRFAEEHGLIGQETTPETMTMAWEWLFDGKKTPVEYRFEMLEEDGEESNK